MLGKVLQDAHVHVQAHGGGHRDEDRIGGHEFLKVGARQVCTVGGLGTLAEGFPAALGHFWGATGDVQGHAAACDLVQGGCFLCQLQRVFVAHIDNAGAHLDVFGGGGHGAQQRHRCRYLRHEVVHAEGSVVDADFVRGLCKVQMQLGDVLGGGAALSTEGVMAKAQKAECFNV